MNNCRSSGSRIRWEIPAHQLGLLWTAACLMSLAGCAKSDDRGEADLTRDRANTAPQPVRAKSTAIRGLSHKIKFKTANGETAFSVKPEDDGAKLVGSDEQELARFNLSDQKMKVKDPDDVVLGYVTFSAGKFKIKNANQDL